MGRMHWVLAGLMWMAAGWTLGAGESKSDAVTMTEKNDGKKVKAARDAILVVQLDSNPTTGYRWDVAQCDETKLKQQGKDTYTARKKGLVGGGGVQTYRFKALAAGTTRLEMKYHRPFEKDQEPAKKFSVTVTIE